MSGLSPDEFREKVRRLKQEDRRVIVALHLFAGGRRKGDVEDYVDQLSEEYSVPLYYFGADLAYDYRWDLTGPSLVAMLQEMVEEGLIDILIGAPPCAT